MLSSFKNQLNTQLDNLSDRDRLALIVLSVFVAVLVLVYAVWLPIQHYHQQAQNNYQQQQELLSWLQAQRGAVTSLPTDQKKNGQTTSAQLNTSSPLTIVNSSAKALQLSIKRVEPENNGDLRLWLENINFDTALQWLQQLQQQGLAIREINVDKQGRGTVNMRVTLKT